jgi:hypothetical protein
MIAIGAGSGLARRGWERVLGPKTLTKWHAIERGGMAKTEFQDRCLKPAVARARRPCWVANRGQRVAPTPHVSVESGLVAYSTGPA